MNRRAVSPVVVRMIGPSAVLLAAAVFLFWNLGEVYLWQDEAATAVLAARMLEHGRPLAWDGRNLITMDHAAAEDPATSEIRSRDAALAVRAYAERGDYREDTAWTGQPWGQFAAAAASIGAFGRTTVAARLPFALAALLTVFLLMRWTSAWLGSAAAGTAAAALLALNAFWILHARQCRYYALSSLFVLLAFGAWWRWIRGGAHGAALFVLAMFGLFQCDYGVFWPVAGVLLAAAAWARGWRNAALAGAVLAAAVAPFAVYYRLFDRLQVSAAPFGEKLARLAFNVNHFIVPFAVIVAALAVAWRAEPAQRRAVITAVAIIFAVVIWSAAVAPFGFHRYVVSLTPIGAFLGAWVALRLGAFTRRPVPALAAIAAILALTSIVSRPDPRAILRSELAIATRAVFDPPPDPNRRVIEWLAPRLEPGDEVLVSYEDIPLMFYTDARVRGGIAAFRVLDESGPPPRFAVLRRVAFVRWPLFQRAIERHRWIRRPVDAPDVPWGNNPDPIAQNRTGTPPPPLLVLERVP